MPGKKLQNIVATVMLAKILYLTVMHAKQYIQNIASPQAPFVLAGDAQELFVPVSNACYAKYAKYFESPSTFLVLAGYVRQAKYTKYCERPSTFCSCQ